MVVGPKLSTQRVPSKSKISMMMIQNFTVQKRHSVIKATYGSLLAVLSIIMATINPLEICTNWYLEMKEGSFIYQMWEKPPYELFSEVWIYNYTNVAEYLRGDDKKMKLQEVGPFTFQEIRTNENITIDHDRGVMTMNPKITLEFIREQSVADLKELSVNMPNIALIAISTLIADRLGYLVNSGAYYSITALGSKLFRNMTIEELFWGYQDPMVSIANTFLPGWIDFAKIGVLDRFYAPKRDIVEVQLRDRNKRFSINTWNGSPGLAEQGYKDFNSSTLCNRIQGAYEGVMLSPNYPKGKEIPILRKQACRIYPFSYEEELTEGFGFKYYRYSMANTAFSRSSPYACNCSQNCLPEGFVDVSNCFYGFPIALSKPHFLDTDPVQLSYFEGMNPDPVNDASFINLEPTIGVPLSLKSNIQVNIAVRMSPGNPITKPLKDKVMPLLWLSMYCKNPPADILSLLRLRFIIAPPLLLTFEILFFIIGMLLGIQGFYRIWKPRYKLVESKDKPARKKSVERRKTSIISNKGDARLFKDDDLAKEAVSLLGTNEEDNEADLFVEKLTPIRKKSKERRKSSYIPSMADKNYFSNRYNPAEKATFLTIETEIPNEFGGKPDVIENKIADKRKRSVILNMADNKIFTDDDGVLFPHKEEVRDFVFDNPIPIRQSANRKVSSVSLSAVDKLYRNDKNLMREAVSLLDEHEHDTDDPDI